MANNFNPNLYNPYNTNVYAQKLQSLQGIKEQADRQIQDLQNMQQMQQQFTNQQPQPHIQQTFQLSNPAVNSNDFDAKYIDNFDDIRNILIYKNTLFISRDISKMWLKDVNGNIKSFELNEIVLDENNEDSESKKYEEKINGEIDSLKGQIEQLVSLIVKQNETINDLKNTQVTENTETLAIDVEEEPVKKAQRKTTKK